MTTLATRRLHLRPLRMPDRDALVRGLNNFNVSRWTGRIPHPYGPADAETIIAACQTLQASEPVLAITLEDELIGVIGLEKGEMGYWVAEPHWGKGFGGEAARAMTAHAFDALGYDQLTASHHEGNAASRRILLGMGFTDTGESMTFSRARNAEVKLLNLVLTRQAWQEAGERRR